MGGEGAKEEEEKKEGPELMSHKVLNSYIVNTRQIRYKNLQFIVYNKSTFNNIKASSVDSAIAITRVVEFTFHSSVVVIKLLMADQI